MSIPYIASYSKGKLSRLTEQTWKYSHNQFPIGWQIVNGIVYSKKLLTNLANGIQFAKSFLPIVSMLTWGIEPTMWNWTCYKLLSHYLRRKTIKTQHNFIISRWIWTRAGTKLWMFWRLEGWKTSSYKLSNFLKLRKALKTYKWFVCHAHF